MKHNVIPVILFILFTFLTFTHCDANYPTVIIPNVGTLVGSTTSSTWSTFTIFQFLGVKYAKPPIGNRRFKAPVLAAERSGIQNAQQNGQQCPTIASIANMTIEEMTAAEDCLHMSIYSKNLTGNQPVMVYIHGGSFYEGSASNHPPNYLLEKDVVLVVPQYRLGPLGFLSTNTEDISGNFGVFDVILALKWVRDHISYFGGTNSSITLFGQSAGAAIAASLLYSPNTPPDLFHKVILQSGSVMNTWAFDGNVEKNSREIAQYAGCTNLETVQMLNSCFMSMDVRTMLTAFLTNLNEKSVNLTLSAGAKLSYGPSSMFPFAPSELKENEDYKNIPILAGTTKHDGSFVFATFFDLLNSTEITDPIYVSNFMLERIIRFLGTPDHSGTFTGFQRDFLFSREIFESGDFHQMINGLIDIVSVTMFKGPILKMFQRRHEAENLFLYSFDYEGEFTRFGYGADTSHYPFEGGIHHSNDNIYVFPFPSFASNLNERDTVVAMTMVDFWTSFATTGIPSSTYCSNWPPFSTHYGPYLHIDEQCSIGTDYIEEFNVASREGINGSISIKPKISLLTGIILILKQFLAVTL